MATRAQMVAGRLLERRRHLSPLVPLVLAMAFTVPPLAEAEDALARDAEETAAMDEAERLDIENDVEPPDAGIAFVDRDRNKEAAWQGQIVYQTGGGRIEADGKSIDVCVIMPDEEGRQDNQVQHEFYMLEESAEGYVERVKEIPGRPEQTRYFVRFIGPLNRATGWKLVKLEFDNREQQDGVARVTPTYDGGYEKDWHVEIKRRTGFNVDGPVGVIVEERGDFVIVEYPTDRIFALRRPRKGELVVRGPDWHAGYADGYDRPWGLLPAGEHRYCGTVLDDFRGDEVHVRWRATERTLTHRYNQKRYYDVRWSPPADYLKMFGVEEGGGAEPRE
jgi:hypothetical protein